MRIEAPEHAVPNEQRDGRDGKRDSRLRDADVPWSKQHVRNALRKT